MRAADALPERRHRLRFEFEPPAAGYTQGKGSPGRAPQLYADGQLIAHNEFLFTTLIADLVRPHIKHRNTATSINKQGRV